jgi:hypothetical protein
MLKYYQICDLKKYSDQTIPNYCFELQKYKKVTSIMKILFVKSPGGTRRHERPKRSCADHVENDLKYAHGVRRWILKHSVREELAAKVSNVQVLQGPYLPWSEGLK